MEADDQVTRNKEPDAVERAGSNGLMVFWARFEDQDVLSFQEWHNCEHMAERVSISGFQIGRRYRVMDENARFLMFYETNTSAVFGSQAYLDALNSPTPWTKEVLTYFRDPVRNIYELIGSVGAPPAFTAPYLIALRFNLEPEKEASLLRVYSEDWLSALCDQPFVLRARLYRVDDVISKIMTSERKIYGGGPGEQRFLSFIEVLRPLNEIGEMISKVSDSIFQNGHGRCDEYADRAWLEIGLEKNDAQQSIIDV